jgi:hypothetical protein
MTSEQAASGWQVRQLTQPGPSGWFHQHCYYDIPVFSADSSRIAAIRFDYSDRPVTADDRVTVGWVDCASGGFEPVGQSAAFSLQQGAMAQWRPGSDELLWADRQDGQLVTRAWSPATGRVRTIDKAAYAVCPDGRHALGLNMDRVNYLRGGYGFAGGTDPLGRRAPDDDGIYSMALDSDESRLILSLGAAKDALLAWLPLKERAKLMLKRPYFWFNHAKVSPEGTRFTVKLRWRRLDGGWNDTQGISLLANIDGSAVSVMARATSHVIWEDENTLFFFSSSAFERPGVFRARRAGTDEQTVSPIAPGLLQENVHMRALPGSPREYVYDTPYREEVSLHLLNEIDQQERCLATFGNHIPARGPNRCDLHPCPSPDGRRVVVTSLEPGGRQIFLVERTG